VARRGRRGAGPAIDLAAHPREWLAHSAPWLTGRDEDVLEAVVEVRMSDVTEMLLEQLAYVRACDRGELERSIVENGDVEIDSKEGQTVAIRAELLLGLEGLIRPEDQTRENLTTISSLAQLILTAARSAASEADHGPSRLRRPSV
jgi:hypothetical protein